MNAPDYRVQYCRVSGKWCDCDPRCEPFEYRPPVDRICPSCGKKHTGRFQLCSACQEIQ